MEISVAENKDICIHTYHFIYQFISISLSLLNQPGNITGMMHHIQEKRIVLQIWYQSEASKVPLVLLPIYFYIEKNKRGDGLGSIFRLKQTMHTPLSIVLLSLAPFCVVYHVKLTLPLVILLVSVVLECGMLSIIYEAACTKRKEHERNGSYGINLVTQMLPCCVIYSLFRAFV